MDLYEFEKVGENVSHEPASFWLDSERVAIENVTYRTADCPNGGTASVTGVAFRATLKDHHGVPPLSVRISEADHCRRRGSSRATRRWTICLTTSVQTCRPGSVRTQGLEEET